jgi:hypothetical protein
MRGIWEVLSSFEMTIPLAPLREIFRGDQADKESLAEASDRFLAELTLKRGRNENTAGS